MRRRGYKSIPVDVDVDVDIEEILEELSEEDLVDELNRRRRGTNNSTEPKIKGKLYTVEAISIIDVGIVENIKRLLQSVTTDKNALLSHLESL
jgi:hypothetical protein